MKEIEAEKIILIDDAQGRFITKDKDLLLYYGKPLKDSKWIEIDELLVNARNKCAWFKDVVVFLKVSDNKYHFYYDRDNSIIKDNREDVLKEIL